MTAAALPTSVLPRLGSLLRLLGSDQDGEALGAARALRRTLGGVGLGLHALADAVERPAAVLRDADTPEPGRKPRRPRRAQPGDVELDQARRVAVCAALRRGLADGRMTEWERTFAGSIVEQLQGRRWRLTERQSETLARLLGKLGESAAWA